MAQFLTIRQTARKGLVSEHYLRLMRKQGKLPGIQTGAKFMVNFDLLLEMLDEESRKAVNTRE